jgi:hypothetical protein
MPRNALFHVERRGATLERGQATPRADASVIFESITSGTADHLHLTSGQPPSASGRNAWSAGIVARTL